jgi:hypothetical protein
LDLLVRHPTEGERSSTPVSASILFGRAMTVAVVFSLARPPRTAGCLIEQISSGIPDSGVP